MHRRLSLLLLPLTLWAQVPEVARRDPKGTLPDLPLPEVTRHGGVRFLDLNGDGHDDLVVSNPQGYGVFLYNPTEKKNVQWEVGWTQVLREGREGDPNALPLLADAAGRDTGARFDGLDLVSADGRLRVTRADLLRVPGPAPLSPAASLAALQLKPGYEARLIAHEPLVQDPVFFDWDARGRLWVVEMGDYPFAPGETTRDGKVGQERVSELQAGRVKILEDTDGDGVCDKATVFLDGLRHPTSLIPWKNGVFIAHIPEILFAEDTDGDGVCDRREPWFSGFTDGNPQHLVNGFCLGLDGWLHCANGDSGGDLVCHKTGKRVALGSNDFRFDPRSGELELEAGRTQYGKWRDAYGNWFGNNNSTWAWHYYLPLAYLTAHPERQPRALRSVTLEEKQVFPISPPMRRFNWASATHTLTSGCSPVPWNDGRDDLLLVCEPANNLVHRQVIDYSAFPIRTARHPEDAGSEFLASRDNWFRPSLAREGPDGALYVADMYRLVLEHPEWIPAEIARGLDLRAGEKLGRIYRIARRDLKPAAFDPRPDSPVRWLRDTAHRLLLEKGDARAADGLRELAAREDLPYATRLQALCTAHVLNPGAVAQPLHDLLRQGHPRVRGAARVAVGMQEVHPEELASWFPAAPKAAPTVAAPVLGRASPDRQKVVARYVAALPGLQGDPARGAVIYERNCMACHRFGGRGIELGPDLATVAAKPDDQLLESIFDPNRAVELRNAAVEIRRKDGGVLMGLIALETPAAVTLRLVGGVELAVPRTEMASQRQLPVSLMPDGLEAVVSEQDAADLLAHLRATAPR